jgi:3-hydroxymyristoyl/3-hydroxydecanoyl-(acyl carrier protein) dehydratase
VGLAAAPPAEATITFCIAPDHPALPGHFPGAPVVPGVLLLAEGLERFGRLAGAPIQCRRIESAKFFKPVAAGATVTATLSMTGPGHASMQFSVAGTSVAHVRIVTTPTAHE